MVELRKRAANHHLFCAQSSTMASRYSPPVLMPAQLESGFDHRFASKILKTRFGFAPAIVAVGTPAAVTRQVRPISGKWASQHFSRMDESPYYHRGLVGAIVHALKCTNYRRRISPAWRLKSRNHEKRGCFDGNSIEDDMLPVPVSARLRVARR